jgi:hypothetical protein
VGPTECTLYAPSEANANTFRSGVIVGSNFSSDAATKWVYQPTPI